MAMLLCFAFLLTFAGEIHGVELPEAINTISQFYFESRDALSNEGTRTSEEEIQTSDGKSDMSASRIPIECLSDPDRGHCTEKIPRWNYDSRKDKCIKFWYGGCEGNGNNFYSKEECEIVCLNERKLKIEPEKYICHKNGYQPYFRSCTKYVFCLNQIGYIMNCPPGLHFNAKTEKCVTPCNAFCDDDFACICKWRKCSPLNAPCTPEGDFPYRPNCKKFLRCENTFLDRFDCPKDQSFDYIKRACVPDKEAVCYS